ncbi:hypothetical protein SAMN04488523_105304 [Sulfitobacter brevis]|uniref:HipA-like C-terminal domain-containing protein n=1 Tax=Sulfitobacter brevis TaxID=74348 RepID=A0A1I1YQX4_9RHOB|nr:hypothetical protein [Sulfitobacter brevis]SFE20360.1 hypothetical protein SAMN04488523_105304 [Sulfitobacter brevis]
MVAVTNHTSLEIVHVDDWPVTEEPLAGTRDKNTVIAPDGTHFVFKEPKELRPAQIWSEMVASFIAGDLLDWPVQTSAIASRAGRVGTLHRYIYDPSRESMIFGYQFCVECDPEFDFDKGTRHTVRLIERIYEQGIGVSEELYYAFWGQALAFDTLISNIDRHAENWAVIQSSDQVKMAALYDNGSSLGCGIEAKGLTKWFNAGGGLIAEKVDNFSRSGRHHLRVEEPAKKGGLFNEVNAYFLNRGQNQTSSFQQCADLDLGPVENFLDDLCNIVELPKNYLMTTQRAQHILSVLHCGRDRVRRLLRQERIG